ncbi:MAG: caspase family protein [Chitinispirillales bacterium]|jgi:hypothetical protein|nr:caspase family protein [Chitinispirillales bacterium]
MRYKIAAVTIMAVLLTVSISGASTKEVHRFLLAAGANDGGSGRATLRYAVTDAQAFAAVLTEMGGIDERNKVFLSDPGIAEIRQGFSNIEKKMNDPRYKNGRKEIIVYYSGHADEKGLRLGKELMMWPDFRKQVDNLNADLKVAILDACGSGAITRVKGGVVRPAFLSDASSDMKGYAFLTSSSESEVSQESDRIRGSFFTHALVSGLRGAADMTGSGTVTLSEAYQFAFNETLQSTQSTIGGAQHPSRDINLTGTGDVVMTDVRQINSGLTLDTDLEGRLFIRDEKGFLIAELYKNKGRTIELGLPEGRYSIHMEHTASYTAENLTLGSGEKVILTPNMLKPVRREITRKRGNDDNSYNADREDEENTQSANPLLDSARAAPFKFNSYIAYTFNDVPANGVQLSLFLNEARAEYSGIQIALMNIAHKDMMGMQLSYFSNIALGRFYGAQGSIFNFAAHGDSSIQGGVVNLAQRVALQGGVVNIAGNVGYVQGGQVNIAKNVGYVQGGVVNIAENVGYFQSGVVNIVKNAGYVQGGVVNIAGETGYGQMGVVNLAGKANYGQIGVTNITGTGDDQIGVVNITGKTKRQIGVVNISGYSEKTPIGVINIVGNGIMDMHFYYDETGRTGVKLHTGTPWLYTLFEYSQIPEGGFEWYDRWPKTWGAGFGTRFGMRAPFFLNLDFAWLQTYTENPTKRMNWDKWNELREKNNYKWSDEQWEYLRDEIEEHWYNNIEYKLRFGLNYSPVKILALSAGVSVNGIIEDKYGDIPIKPKHHKRYRNVSYKDHNARIWPGFYAGFSVGKF